MNKKLTKYLGDKELQALSNRARAMTVECTSEVEANMEMISIVTKAASDNTFNWVIKVLRELAQERKTACTPREAIMDAIVCLMSGELE